MGKKTNVILISLIPVVIIFAAAFSAEIVTLSEESKKATGFTIPIEPNEQNGGAFSYNTLQEYLTTRLYVPNYDTKVTIVPSQHPIIIVDNLRFRVSMEDTGIIPLDSPYFYIYIVDPNNKVRGCFPDCKFDRYVPFWNMTSKPASSSGQGIYNLKTPILPVKINNALFGFYRESLVAGKGYYRYEKGDMFRASKSAVDFYYNFTPTSVGDWEVYVLVFNEEYNKRDGSGLFKKYERELNNDLVNYGKAVITVKNPGEVVVPKKSKWPFLLKMAAALIRSVLTFIAVYIPLDKFYGKFMRFVRGAYREWYFYAGLILLLVGFSIVQFLLSK